MKRSVVARRPRHAGVVALEFALLVPVVGLLLLAVVLAGVHAVDQIVVQDAARAGVRSAATTTADGPPRSAALEAAGGREVRVVILPVRRVEGGRVNVSVVYTRDVGWLSWTVHGRATATVEPGV